jgi:hypothetical protein
LDQNSSKVLFPNPQSTLESQKGDRLDVLVGKRDVTSYLEGQILKTPSKLPHKLSFEIDIRGFEAQFGSPKYLEANEETINATYTIELITSQFVDLSRFLE